MKISRFLLITALAFSGLAQDASCPELEEGFSAQLHGMWMAKEPRLESHFESLASARQRCPASETLAYLHVRIAEISGALGHPLPESGWEAFLQQTFNAFPKSARIATVVARATGTLTAARQALALDPTYVPARVVLAECLVKTGDAPAALQAIEPLQGLECVPDGYTVLALARSAAGDDARAIEAAQLTLHGRPGPFVEPFLTDAVLHAAVKADELLGITYLKQKRYDQAAKHLLAAAPHSEKARYVVEHPGQALYRALHRALHQALRRPLVEARRSPD